MLPKKIKAKHLLKNPTNNKTCKLNGACVCVDSVQTVSQGDGLTKSLLRKQQRGRQYKRVRSRINGKGLQQSLCQDLTLHNALQAADGLNVDFKTISKINGQSAAIPSHPSHLFMEMLLDFGVITSIVYLVKFILNSPCSRLIKIKAET